MRTVININNLEVMTIWYILATESNLALKLDVSQIVLHCLDCKTRDRITANHIALYLKGVVSVCT